MEGPPTPTALATAQERFLFAFCPFCRLRRWWRAGRFERHGLKETKETWHPIDMTLTVQHGYGGLSERNTGRGKDVYVRVAK
jgi:hypothetical protein